MYTSHEGINFQFEKKLYHELSWGMLSSEEKYIKLYYFTRQRLDRHLLIPNTYVLLPCILLKTSYSLKSHDGRRQSIC